MEDGIAIVAIDEVGMLISIEVGWTFIVMKYG